VLIKVGLIQMLWWAFAFSASVGMTTRSGSMMLGRPRKGPSSMVMVGAETGEPLVVSSVANFRDLHEADPVRVAPGKVYRMAFPEVCSEEDAMRLGHIKTLLDLRSPEERAALPGEGSALLRQFRNQSPYPEKQWVSVPVLSKWRSGSFADARGRSVCA